MSYIKNNQSPSNAKTKEVTGFVSPELMTSSYNPGDRTFILSGEVEAYYQGKLINVLINGWVSSPHPEGKTVSQFLYYNGTNFIWSDDPWIFSYLQIARTFYDTGNLRHVGFQEHHGFLQWQQHENSHYNIGARKASGGQSSGTILNSTTDTNRRPNISQSTNSDEDLLVTIPALTSKLYTRFYLSGTSANPVANFSTDNTDIISLSTNRPYYNQLTGGNWQQTLMPNNAYTSVYVIQMPVSTDIDSQKYRFLFVQGQNISQGGSAGANATALANQLALDPASLNVGNLNTLNPEYCIIHQYVVKYDGTNWTLQGEQAIVGSKQKPVIVTGTTGLTSVATDGITTSGNGTPTDPVIVINPYTPPVTTTVTVDTPIFTNQPTISGSLDASFKIWNEDYYFVTKKIIDKSATQDNAVFTATTLVITEASATFIIGDVVSISGSSILLNNKLATITNVANNGTQSTYTFAASTFTAGTSTTNILVTTSQALPANQFKLTELYDGYATAINQIFTLANLNTGNSGTLAENTAVDFKAIGVDWKLRNANVTSITVNTNITNTTDFIVNASVLTTDYPVTAVGFTLKDTGINTSNFYNSTQSNSTIFCQSRSTTTLKNKYKQYSSVCKIIRNTNYQIATSEIYGLSSNDNYATYTYFNTAPSQNTILGIKNYPLPTMTSFEISAFLTNSAGGYFRNGSTFEIII